MTLTFAQQPDPEWRKRLLAIQDIAESRGMAPANRGGFKIARNGTKRSTISVLPEVHTFHASEVSAILILCVVEFADLKMTIVTLEEVEDADHFVENLENIEPP